MQQLATILRSCPIQPDDRVTLYDNGTVNVWADDGQLYETDTPLDHLTSAWGGDAWDLQLTDGGDNDT